MTIDQAGTAQLEVRLPTPHPKQELFIHSDKKRRIIKAGRRSGKTCGVSIYAVEQFCQGRRVLYGAPVTQQLDAFWIAVKDALSQGISSGLLVKNETDHSIDWDPAIIRRLKPETRKQYLNNQIRGKTCYNYDGLRGDFADCLILDEVQLMNEEAYEKAALPMLMDKGGNAVLCFTPPSLRSRSASKATDKQWANKLYKKCLDDPRWLCLHFTSHDNPYLSEEGIAEVTKDMTQLAYTQEILAEDIDEIPGAVWKRRWIEDNRVLADQVPDLEVVVVGVDPPGSATTECGIIAAGKGPPPRGQRDDGLRHMYVLDDHSMLAPTSRAWAQASVSLYYERKADRLIGERNYGGDMVEGTIRQIERGDAVSYSDANATRGKIVRAQPLAAAYERGRVHHVGTFAELEDEMCNYVEGDKSPNRMDACWIAGTMIRTDHGELPIENVQPGMKVLTRIGYRTVKRSGPTGRRSVVSRGFPNGRILIGTPEHLIFTANRGFCSMDSLVWCDMLKLCIEKPSFLRTSNTIAILTVPAGVSAFISLAAKTGRLCCFIGKCIERPVVRFLKSIMSTIKTITLSTMNRRILSLFRQPIIMPNCAEYPASDGASILLKSDLWPAHGIEAQRADHGTVYMARNPGSEESLNLWESAKRVARKLEDLYPSAFVIGTVIGSSKIESIDIREMPTAQSAGKNFGKTNTLIGPNVAHADVGECFEVFNLEVDGPPEYFANGVLVHNCVWCGLRLLEGLDVLGVLDYFSSGKARADMNNLGKIQAVTTLAKPMVAEAAPGCPNCKSKFIIKSGRQLHCNACGETFDPPGAKPFQAPVASRRDFLK